jgi:hypothetical protein
MSTFVEVSSQEKNCTVIVNLDSVLEIAPLLTGGSALFFENGSTMRVLDNYDMFKQFALQTVTAEDIAKKFKTKPAVKGSVGLQDIPTFGS